MAAADPGFGVMTLNPKQKKIAAAVGGGGLLALVVLMTRGGSSSSTATGDPGGVANGGVTAQDPSSFADNGASMGELSSSVTSSLGGLGTAFDNFTNAFANQPAPLSGDDVAAGVAAGLGSYFAQHPSDPPAPAQAPGQLAAAGQPAKSVAAQSAAPSTSAVKVATHGSTPGDKYTEIKNVTRNGVKGVIHDYGDHRVFVPSVRTP